MSPSAISGLPSDPAEIKVQAVRSVKWGLLNRAVNVVGIPALSILLARALTPDDFGIIEIANLVLVFLTMFHLALGKAVIQREEASTAAIDLSFWLNLAFSGTLFLLLLTAAPLLARLFRDQRLVAVLRVIGLHYFTISFGVVPNALLERTFRYRRLAWIQLLPMLAIAVVAIPLAIGGFGYWSLILALLVGGFIKSATLWLQSDWRPRHLFQARLAHQLLRFTGFVFLESLLAWILVYFDRAVIGRQIGTQALGYYSLSWSLMMVAISLPITALSNIMLAAFSRLQNRPAELRAAYLEGTRLIAAYTLPAGVGLALLARPLVATFMGEAWQPMAPILAVLALYAGFGHLWVLNTEAFKAIGRPELMVRIYLPLTLIMVPIYLLSAPYGLLVFTIARSSVVLIGALPHTYYAVKALHLSPDYLWRSTRAPLSATAIMALAMALFSPHAVDSALDLAAMALLGLGSYLAALSIVAPRLLRRLMALAREAISLMRAES